MRQDRILVAVSGGIDSMVLLHRCLKETGSDGIAVAHCNFNLRGAQSDSDEALVVRYCRENTVECHTHSFSTSERADAEGMSIQEMARKLRYDWFDALMDEHGYRSVATAHHDDDSAETFLMNLMRGTGLDGLTGIRSVEERRVSRPLMGWGRADILEYAEQHDVPWREDASNSSEKYLRNRVRRELMPLMNELRAGASDGIKTTIAHLQETIALLKESLESMRKAIVEERGDDTYFDLNALMRVEQKEVLLFEWLKRHGFSFTQIEDILGSERPGARVLTKRHGLYRTQGHIILSSLNTSEEKSWSISMDSIPADLPFDLTMKIVDSTDQADSKDPYCEYFDLDSIALPLSLRRWKDGDRMRPLGMNGSKLISDILTDEKWPIQHRASAYVISDQARIIWLVGLKINNSNRLRQRTKQVLRLKVNRPSK